MTIREALLSETRLPLLGLLFRLLSSGGLLLLCGLLDLYRLLGPAAAACEKSCCQCG